jgi:hypothetical protein
LLQQVEAVSITVVQSGGLKRELLTVGSAVRVRAHPQRRGVGTVLGADITTSDGNTYALGGTGRSSRPPVATVPASGLAGNWTPGPNPLLLPTISRSIRTASSLRSSDIRSDAGKAARS